jgi:hypothetical protein
MSTNPTLILVTISIFILILSFYLVYKYPIGEEHFYYFNNNECPICYNQGQLQSICSSRPDLHRCCESCKQNIIQSSLNRDVPSTCPMCRNLVDSTNVRDRVLQLLQEESEGEDDLDALDEEPSLMLNNAIEEGNLEQIIELQNEYDLPFTAWNLDDAIRTRRTNIVRYILDHSQFPTHINLVQLAQQNRMPNDIVERIRSRL